jgi:aspartyl-tRNA(Asn)/glutamyl-tRNA(Gln) amidotransferase subunit A
MTDLSRMSATELASAFRTGEVSPVEATQAALDAISAYEADVNAFVLVDGEKALESASAAERRWQSGEPVGPVDGVPTSIKDIFLTRGWPTLRGSNLISEDDDPWDADAPVTARLREAGAVLLGKTTTPEFAWKGVTDSIRHGVTRNPWDTSLTPGGSSGGSAAAVALGMGAWSVGTDGGGSVRIPASFTATVALKPTYGLVSLYPASPFGTLAHGGPMARTVGDTALMMDLLTGFDSRDWSALPTPVTSFRDGLDDGVEGLRIAFSATLGFGENHPEVETAFLAAVGELAAAGALVDEVDPGFADPRTAFELLWFAGGAKVMEKYGEEALGRIDPLLADRVRGAESYTASEFLDATQVRMDLGLLMGRFHERYDLLVTPTVPIPPFRAGQDAPDGWPSPLWTSWTPYTYPFNMTQQPALSVPCGFTRDGRPVGLQIVGPRHADALVLRAGRAYERRTDWGDRMPPRVAQPTQRPSN